MRPPSGDPRAVIGIVTGGHFLSHFYLLAFPPLFPMLREDFGLDAVGFGLVMSVVAVGMFLQVPAGGLVERVGAKRVFVAGVAVTSGGIAAAGLADSYPLLLAAALVSGVGQAAFHPADYTLLDAVTDGSAEGKSFGVHTFGGYAGFAVAPLAVGGLASAFDWRVALLAVGGAGVAYALFAHVVTAAVHRPSGTDDTARGERRPLAERTRALLRPSIVVLAVFFVGLVMGQKGVSTFTPLFVSTQLGMTEVAGNTVLTVFFSAGAVGVLAGGVLADRYDPHLVAITTLTAGSAALGALVSGVLGTGAVVAYPLFAFVGLCYGLPLPSRDRLVSAASSSTGVGTSFGVVFTAAAVGSFVSPTLLGAIIERAGTGSAFAAIAGFFLLAAGVVVLLKVGAVGERTTRLGTRADPAEGDD
jgi:MFS family permease